MSNFQYSFLAGNNVRFQIPVYKEPSNRTATFTEVMTGWTHHRGHPTVRFSRDPDDPAVLVIEQMTGLKDGTNPDEAAWWAGKKSNLHLK